ncbi:MAG TPA: ATP-dependent DNA helicase RecG [Candidatus Methylacidiphilales bacterium]
MPRPVPISEIPGIPPQRLPLLQKLGLRTRDDLLFHLPRRYEDRLDPVSLAIAPEGEPITVAARIVRSKLNRWRGGRAVFEAIFQPLHPDDRTEALRALWFSAYYLVKSFLPDMEVLLYGKAKRDKNGKGWVMTHPEFEIMEHDGDESIHLNRIVPIYALTEGLPQRALRRILYRVVKETPIEIEDPHPFPKDLPPLREALPQAHFPDSWDAQVTARRRLVYDEFFVQQCILCRRRMSREKVFKQRAAAPSSQAATTKPGVEPPLHAAFLANLPFAPTGAQKRAMEEIDRDLQLPTPMNRLLQGDVGAGKTLVAVHAMLRAVERGETAALMAPTEILAEQHYLNLKRWLDPLGISVGLHTGSKKKGDRSPMDSEPMLRSLFGSKGTITVGTHALIYDSFIADKLGLVVIDEQHKFGVMQRLALSKKGSNPDILVMTATPIPRTLAMSVYGDLDCSVLDELPPGRGKIVTACRGEADLPKVWKFIREETQAGRQAYVVYPLIDESDKVEAKAVQKEYERLKVELAPAVVGLLHGRLKPDEKEEVMEKFRRNEIQVLVSTPVIEVGVDVPNSTIMVIENAERFGLAQLHQLRGRIGRGGNKSYCVLVGQPKSEESWRRLKVMEQTTDGFKIAEEDLRIRGPGDILGTDQSGLPPLRFGDPLRDFEMLRQAKTDAENLLRADPQLKKWPALKAILDGDENAVRRQSLAMVS